MIKTKIDEMIDVAEPIEQLEATLRASALTRAGKKAGTLVRNDARPRITAPGYRGDKAGLPALRDSIEVVVREYPTVFVVLVGAAWPDGAHGHLVEFGHKQKRADGTEFHVPPHPWLRPAAVVTREAQAAAIESELAAAVKK